MQVAYFVHDVHDAAVARRVRLLQAGGAIVQVLGFRRRDEVRGDIDGAPVYDLGRTVDAALKARAGLVAFRALSAAKLAKAMRGAEVVLARSLELLVIASAAIRAGHLKAPLVYECVDIHRLMVSDGLIGRILRAVERRLMGGVSLLMTSSPAFRDRYFRDRQGLTPRTLVLENKLFSSAPAPSAVRRPGGPPWRIGWFGMIRCRRSLDILCDLAACMDGAVEICIAGRPSLGEFTDFYGQVSKAPNVTFVGPYNEDDIGRLYQSVHFSWAIDFFEAGANSDWLLPNRLYEGCAYGAVPLGVAGVETARWMSKAGLGLVFDGADLPSELDCAFSTMTATKYRGLALCVEQADQASFIMNGEDGVALVNLLRALETA